jgi:hypothetical protein
VDILHATNRLDSSERRTFGNVVPLFQGKEVVTVTSSTAYPDVEMMMILVHETLRSTSRCLYSVVYSYVFWMDEMTDDSNCKFDVRNLRQNVPA